MNDKTDKERGDMSDKLSNEELKDVAGGADQSEDIRLGEVSVQDIHLLDGDKQGLGMDASANAEPPGQRRSFR